MTTEATLVRQRDSLAKRVRAKVDELCAERDSLVEVLKKMDEDLTVALQVVPGILAASSAAPKPAEKKESDAEPSNQMYTSLRKRNEALQKDLMSATKQVSKMEGILAETKGTLQKTREQNASLQEKLARKGEDLTRTMELLHDRTDERDVAVERVAERQRQIEDLEQRLQAAEKRATAAEEETKVNAAEGLADTVDIDGLRRHLSSVAKYFDEDAEKSMRALARAMKIIDAVEGGGNSDHFRTR